jgi:hypothetical protein
MMPIKKNEKKYKKNFTLANSNISISAYSESIQKHTQLGVTPMKLQTIAFSTLIALTAATTASADWMDGFQNGQGNGQLYGNSNGYGTSNGQAYGTGKTDVNGFGRGNGNADGEIEFQITFKGKGKTDMKADSALEGNGTANGYGTGLANGYGNTAGNSQATSTGANATSAAPTTGVVAAPVAPQAATPVVTAPKAEVTAPTATK